MDGANIYLDLYDNAIDSLTVSIDAFLRGEVLPNYYKVSIKEMFAAFELFFKELLNQEHEAFIYENVEDIGKPIQDRRSVKFETLLKRLKLFANIEIDEKYLQTIERLRVLRNMSVHSSFEFNKYNVADLISKSVPLFVRIVREYYDGSMTLEALIGKEYSVEYFKIQKAIEGLNKEAERKFEAEKANFIPNKYFEIRCIKCNSKYIQNKRAEIICYCCHAVYEVNDFFQTLVELEDEFDYANVYECPNCRHDTMFEYLPHQELYCLNCEHKECLATCSECFKEYPINELNDITDCYNFEPPDIVVYMCNECQRRNQEMNAMYEEYE